MFHLPDFSPLDSTWTFGRFFESAHAQASVWPEHPEEPMADAEPLEAKHERHRRRLANLIDRLPNRLRSATHWLLRPESRWARVPKP